MFVFWYILNVIFWIVCLVVLDKVWFGIIVRDFLVVLLDLIYFKLEIYK